MNLNVSLAMHLFMFRKCGKINSKMDCVQWSDEMKEVSLKIVDPFRPPLRDLRMLYLW